MKGIANTLVTSDTTKGFLDGVIGVTDVLNKSVKLSASLFEHSFKGTLDDAIGDELYKGFDKFQSMNLFDKMFGDWGGQFSKLGTTMSTVLGKGIESVFSNMTFLGKTLDPILKLFEGSNKLGKDNKLDNSIDERKQNINGIQAEINSLKNQKASLDEVMESYEKLSNKTKRSAKENQQLMEIREQLAQTNPDMVAGYDGDGNVILKNAKLYNAELERQIKMKQQSQRIEENTLANEAYERRINQAKEYNELMEKNKKANLAYDSDKKEGLFGVGSESTQEYFARLKEGNEQLAKQNAETYQKSLEAYQQYVEDERAIQERHINQMETSNSFKKMTEDQKESILGLMNALDWSGLSLTEGSNVTRQLEQLGDKVVSTTEQMGKHSDAINKLEADYSKGTTSLKDYADGVGKIYESAGKLDVESFGNLQSEIQSYVDATGDLEGANRMIDGLANSLYKVTKIPKNTWKDLLVMDPAPIDASNQALQRFLQTYDTSIDKWGKDNRTDKLVSQFETVQTSLSQLTNDVFNGGTIDAEYLLNMKVNQPEPIQNLIDEIVKDGVDPETELPILVNAMIDILNTGEITDDTISQIADLFGMTEAEVRMLLNVETEVVGMTDLESEIESWNSLSDEEKRLLLKQISEGGDEIRISKEEWEGLSEEEKIQKLRQLLEEEGNIEEAGEEFENAPEGEKNAKYKVESEGEGEVEGASEEFENAPEGEKSATYKLKTEGEGKVEKTKQSVEGLPTEKDTRINITEGNPGVTGKIREDLEGVPKQTTAKVDVEVGGDASGGSSIKDKIKKLLGFGNGETTKVPVNVEIDAKPTGSINLKDKIKSLLGFGSGGTTEQITVDAKVGKVDTSSISNVNTKPVEVEAKVGKVDTSSISSVNVAPIEIEAKVGKVDTSSINSINVQPIEVKANVSSALGQINSIKSALSGIQTKNITVNVSGNALSQVNSIKSAMAGIQSKSVSINASGNALGQINSIKSAIAGLQSKSIAISTSVGGVAQVNALKASIASLQGKSVSVSASTSGTGQVNALTSAIARVNSKSVSVTANVNGTGAVNALISAINRVKSKSVTVSAKVSGTGAVQSLASAIAAVKSKSATVSVTKRVTTVQSSVPAGRSATPMLANTSLSSIPVSMSSPVSISSSKAPTVSASDVPTVSNAPVSAKASTKSPFNISKILPSLDFDINMFKNLEEALKRLGGQIEFLNEKAEATFGKEKVKLLEQQIPLLRQQQKIQEQIAMGERSQNNELIYWLKRNGFKIDNLGNVENYNDKLLAMEQNVKSLKDKYDSLSNAKKKNESATEKAKNAYESANKTLEKAKKYLEEYFATNNEEITEASKKWWEYENAIKEVNKELKELERNKVLEPVKNSFQEVEYLLDRCSDKLDLLDEQYKHATNAQKVEYLTKKQQILNEQLAEQEEAYKRIHNLAGKLQNYLWQFGFKLDENSLISNYDEVLNSLVGTEEYERAKEYADEYMEVVRGDLVDIQVEAYETKNALKEMAEEMQEALEEARQGRLEPFKNTLVEVRNELDRANDRLDLLDADSKFAVGTEKIDSLQNRIGLLNEKLEITQREFNALHSLIGETQNDLWQYGFKLDANSLISNYDEVLNALAGTDKYENAKKVADEYMELMRDDYIENKLTILETQNEIKEAYEEMLDATKKIEDELTDIIKKENEKRKKEIENQTKERIKALEKLKDEYNEMRDQQQYDKSIREQTSDIAELQKQIDIARKDQSLSGQKKLQELIKEMEEAQKKLQETTQDKIDEDYNNNIDKEIERLEDEEEKLISILDEKFSDENIAKMVQQGLTSGFVELNGEIISIQELLMKSVDESAQAYSVMANTIKNELITNLNVALSTMEDLSRVYRSLGIENFSSALNANASSLSIPDLGGSKTENKITVGDTNITIQGSIDNATLEEIEALIDQKNKRILEEITSGL